MSDDKKVLVPWEQDIRHGGLMDKAAMRRNLLDFKRVMDIHAVPFFLIFGTLLGATRGQSFIDWDTDVDVGCFYEDYEKIGRLTEAFRGQGFKVLERDIIPPMDGYYIRENEKIEIWFFKKEDEFWAYDKRVRYPRRFLDDLDTMKFLGTEFRTPKNKEEFLKVTYGADWIIPDPDKEYIL